MAEARWLSDEEQRVWREYLWATAMLREHLARTLHRDAGMPHTYYEVLVTLSESPDRRLRMGELADACHVSRSKLSHAVNRMEQAGWISRDECDADKRGSWARLTDEGMRVLERVAPAHVTTVREALFDVLTPEQVRQLGEICTAVRRNLAPTCEKVAARDAAAEDAAAEDADDIAAGPSVPVATTGDEP